jgi:hypothetical protein
MAKCDGEPQERYPGLRLSSAIETRDGSCHVRSSTPARHTITVTNASLLTYGISYRSTCDKAYLRYISADDEGDAHVWEGGFTAPYRWDGEPRASSDEALLAAKSGKAAASNREVGVVINCKAPTYAVVGPFQVLLQVDTSSD